MNQCKQYNLAEFNKAFTNQQNISMIHLNIRSSQKNLIDFVCNLDNLIVKIDFIILSETLGTDDKAKFNVIPDYIIYNIYNMIHVKNVMVVVFLCMSMSIYRIKKNCLEIK